MKVQEVMVCTYPIDDAKKVLPEKPEPLDTRMADKEADKEKEEFNRQQEENNKTSRATADVINSVFQKGITLEDNMSGHIVEITLPSAGTEVGIRHNLKVTPKYRIILKHKGNGIILDGDTAWNGTTAYFKASQATENIKATILLMRG